MTNPDRIINLVRWLHPSWDVPFSESEKRELAGNLEVFEEITKPQWRHLKKVVGDRIRQAPSSRPFRRSWFLVDVSDFVTLALRRERMTRARKEKPRPPTPPRIGESGTIEEVVPGWAEWKEGMMGK